MEQLDCSADLLVFGERAGKQASHEIRLCSSQQESSG